MFHILMNILLKRIIACKLIINMGFWGFGAVWEKEPLEQLAAEGQLMAFRHGEFWQPMDTLRERRLLEEIWQTGAAPWRVD